MKSLNYLNKYLLKYKFQISMGILFVILGNIFALFPAHLIGRSFDLITSEINNAQLHDGVNLNSLYSVLSIYAGLLILVALIRGVFMFFMRQYIIVASRHIEHDLKNEIFRHYQNLSAGFYKLHDSGDLLNRITEDVSKVRMYLGPAIMYSVNLFTLIILIVSRMLLVSPELTLIVLAPLPLLSVLIYKVSNQINSKSSIVQQKLSVLTNVAQETFSGIRLIKALVRENNMMSYFNYISKSYMSNSISLSFINSVFFPLVLLLVGVSVLLTVYMGGVFVVRGVVSVGEVAEFIIYVNMLTWPATSIGWVTEVIQRAAASQTRINEFLSQHNYTNFHHVTNMKHTYSQVCHNIQIQNLSYKYQDSNFLVLNSISLNILQGDMIGVVGHVGSGKSTMLQILCGILSPSRGNVFFDNISHQKLNWHQFRNEMSYVSQDVFLFSDSIRNNILFGHKDVSDVVLLDIAKKLCFFNEINSFQDGLDTHIGEGGVTLSGGQKQRIALARALIRRPKLLLLDDALSNVDSETELKIMHFIKSEFQNTTIVLTSNRLSILTYCTNIIVLKSGCVVQKGDHNTLIVNQGEYQKLFFNQMDNQ